MTLCGLLATQLVQSKSHKICGFCKEFLLFLSCFLLKGDQLDQIVHLNGFEDANGDFILAHKMINFSYYFSGFFRICNFCRNFTQPKLVDGCKFNYLCVCFDCLRSFDRLRRFRFLLMTNDAMKAAGKSRKLKIYHLVKFRPFSKAFTAG